MNSNSNSSNSNTTAQIIKSLVFYGEERMDAYMNDIIQQAYENDGNYDEKLKELQEWVATAKTDVEKSKETTKLIVAKSPFPAEWDDMVDDVIKQGVGIACVADIKVKENAPGWIVTDDGHRFVKYKCDLKYGKGKALVRMTFASRKFNQISIHVGDDYDYALIFQIKYDLPKCCLCGIQFVGFGNNPYPLKDEKHDCCNDCNTTKVIPARLRVVKIGQEGKRTTDEEFIKSLEALGDDIEIPVYVPKKVVKKVTDEDIAEQIQKSRKEAEQRAKLEAETERLKAEVKRLKEKKVEISDAKITITINVTKNGEDDEAKEIRRRAKQIKVKVKTKNGGK
jgi:hypothetical protein